MYGLRSSIKWKSTETYTVPGSKDEGDICENVPHAGRSRKFFVTSFQLAPPSFEYHSLPSLVPAQIRPFWIFENSMSQTTSPLYWPRLSPMSPPFDTTRDGSFVERSGLASVQDCPPLVVLRMS